MGLRRLEETIKKHEGLRLFPYQDSTDKLIIGYGRNLGDVGISHQEADLMFFNDLEVATSVVESVVSNFRQLNRVRQEVLINMAFNLGKRGLMSFQKMLFAIKTLDFDRAADEMLDSRWARLVGPRATMLAMAMRKG